MEDKNQGNGRVTAPNPPPAGAAGPVTTMQVQVGGQAPQEGQAPIGFTVSQQAMQDIANIMKTLPWEQVFQTMPEVLSAQAIYGLGEE